MSVEINDETDIKELINEIEKNKEIIKRCVHDWEIIKVQYPYQWGRCNKCGYILKRRAVHG